MGFIYTAHMLYLPMSWTFLLSTNSTHSFHQSEITFYIMSLEKQYYCLNNYVTQKFKCNITKSVEFFVHESMKYNTSSSSITVLFK